MSPKLGLMYGSGLLAFNVIEPSTGLLKKTIFPLAMEFGIEGESGEVLAHGMRKGVEIITGSANNLLLVDRPRP
jgi:hypothetical protein